MEANKKLKFNFGKCRKLFLGSMTSMSNADSVKAASDCFDVMVADFAHGDLNQELAAPIVKNCRECGIATLARVQSCEELYLSKAMDIGLDGVIIPNVESAEQIEKTVEAIRMAPAGSKNYGGESMLYNDESIEEYNSHRYVVIEIASACGCEQLEAILEAHKSDISAVMIDPINLAISLGLGMDHHDSKVYEKIFDIIEICRKYKKLVGAMCPTFADFKYYFRAGIKMLWYGSDNVYFKNGIESVCDFKLKLNNAAVEPLM